MTPEQYLERAQTEFAKIAAHTPGDPRPDDPLLCLQLDLYRWQVNHFGLCSDLQFAAGVVEEMGELADARMNELYGNGSFEEIDDAVGDVAIYASQLLTSNRLGLNVAVEYALELARARSTAPTTTLAVATAGRLMHVVLKRSQRIRGFDDRDVYRAHLLQAVAGCMSHSGVCSLSEVILKVGREVMQRTHGHAAIPERA